MILWKTDLWSLISEFGGRQGRGTFLEGRSTFLDWQKWSVKWRWNDRMVLCWYLRPKERTWGRAVLVRGGMNGQKWRWLTQDWMTTASPKWSFVDFEGGKVITYSSTSNLIVRRRGILLGGASGNGPTKSRWTGRRVSRHVEQWSGSIFVKLIVRLGDGNDLLGAKKDVVRRCLDA